MHRLHETTGFYDPNTTQGAEQLDWSRAALDAALVSAPKKGQLVLLMQLRELIG